MSETVSPLSPDQIDSLNNFAKKPAEANIKMQSNENPPQKPNALQKDLAELQAQAALPKLPTPNINRDNINASALSGKDVRKIASQIEESQLHDQADIQKSRNEFRTTQKVEDAMLRVRKQVEEGNNTQG